jgi:hypothetical protein
MRNLLTSAALAVLAGAGVYTPANAGVIINGITYIDPTSFHVTATGATGSDPVLLNNTRRSAFRISAVRISTNH